MNWLAKNDVAALIVKLVDYPELIRQGVDVLAFLGGLLSILIFCNLQNLIFVFLQKIEHQRNFELKMFVYCGQRHWVVMKPMFALFEKLYKHYCQYFFFEILKI